MRAAWRASASSCSRELVVEALEHLAALARADQPSPLRRCRRHTEEVEALQGHHNDTEVFSEIGGAVNVTVTPRVVSSTDRIFVQVRLLLQRSVAYPAAAPAIRALDSKGAFAMCP